MSVSYKDYNAFFFEILPQINRDLSELSYELEVIKNELENVLKLQLAEADRIIRNIFEIADASSIVNYFVEKYEDDWSQKEHKVFDYQTNGETLRKGRLGKAEGLEFFLTCVCCC